MAARYPSPNRSPNGSPNRSPSRTPRRQGAADCDIHTVQERLEILKKLLANEEEYFSSLLYLDTEFGDYMGNARKKSGSFVIPENLTLALTGLPHILNVSRAVKQVLAQRIDDWNNNPQIADLFRETLPFFKIFKDYARHVEDIQAKFGKWGQKYSTFYKVLDEFEKSWGQVILPQLQKPLGRLLKYQNTLREYKLILSDGSDENRKINSVIDAMEQVMAHIRRNDPEDDAKREFLKDLNNSIIGDFNVLVVGRELIKMGDFNADKCGKTKDVNLLLFNDCLVITRAKPFGKFKLKRNLPIHEVMVAQAPIKEEFTITSPKAAFRIYGSDKRACLAIRICAGNGITNPIKVDEAKKALIKDIGLVNRVHLTVLVSVENTDILGIASEKETNDWVAAINLAKEKLQQNKASLRQLEDTTVQNTPDMSGACANRSPKLGEVTPHWKSGDKVSLCPKCRKTFGVFLKREHCRACGEILCKNCVCYKAPLKYVDSLPSSVCGDCYHKLYNDAMKDVMDNMTLSEFMTKFSYESKSAKKSAKKPTLTVLRTTSATDLCDHNGYLFQKEKLKWNKYWFIIKNNTLFRFKAAEDQQAIGSLPLLGFDITKEGVKEGFKIFKRNTTAIEPTIYKAENETENEKWVKTLQDNTVLIPVNFDDDDDDDDDDNNDDGDDVDVDE